MSRTRSIIKPGTRLSETDAEAVFGSALKGLIAQGRIVLLSQQYENPDSPFTSNQIPLPANSDTRTKVKPMQTAERTNIRDTSPSVDVIKPKFCSWTVDPSTLTGKDVAELNVMIAERTNPTAAGKAEQFETPEEAIAWLSQDYETADTPQVATT